MRVVIFLCFILANVCSEVHAQNLYSARGYWEESSKPNYLSIKQRFNRGDSLSTNEVAYLNDYETYLNSYFQRMTIEKEEYARMKERWDKELITTQAPVAPTVNTPDDVFELRNRDRVVTTLYGVYYGTSLVVVAGIDGAAAAGIPLITGGLSLMGPTLQPKKYEGITRSTVRAGNTGKLLGLGYGAALGLALGGDSEETGKIALALSTIGSLSMGGVAFHLQKQRHTPIGQIELMRHYGILSPLVAASLLAVGQVDNPNLYGVAFLGGGISGLLIGNKVSKKYDYSQGDVDAISTLTWVSAGVGLTFVAEAVSNGNGDPTGLILVPASTAVLGTLLGQKAVKGVHLTSKQGSTLQLATGGAALIGLGIVVIAESESAGVIVGVPSVLALITHQLIFHDLKMKNLESNLKRGDTRKHLNKFSFQVTPENYFMNKKLPVQKYSPQMYSGLQGSLLSLRFTF